MYELERLLFCLELLVAPVLEVVVHLDLLLLLQDLVQVLVGVALQQLSILFVFLETGLVGHTLFQHLPALLAQHLVLLLETYQFLALVDQSSNQRLVIETEGVPKHRQ